MLGAAVAIMIAASPSMRDPAHRSGSNVVVCDANTTHGLDVLDAKWFADSLREAAIALSIDVAASPLADVAVGGARKFGIGDAVV